MQDLRKGFDADPAGYETGRPGYPDKLFTDLLAYAGLNPGGRALEIGIGTGQATLPLLQAGLRVDAVELGPKLAAFSRQKFARWPAFYLHAGDFMELDLPAQAFDLAFSASAFHWLPKGRAYGRLRYLLKPGGTAALFWAHSALGPGQELLAQELARVYASLGFPFSPAAPDFPRRMERKANGLRKRGFKGVQAHYYEQSRQLDADGYIALLRSSAHHHGLGPDERLRLETIIRGVLEIYGNKVLIRERYDLYLGRS